MSKRMILPSIMIMSACALLSAGTGWGSEPASKQAIDPGGIPPGMASIPGGTFEMGSDEEDIPLLQEMGSEVPHMSESHAHWCFAGETPRHEVAIEAFFLDAHEVTNAEYSRFVEETGYEAEGNWREWAQAERTDHPVVNVTWQDAKAYAEWAGKRLPGEAEWEYAARGGCEHCWFPWGDEPDPTLANYGHDLSFWSGLRRILGLAKPKTTAVGSYPPNDFGLYDICGNVQEWCEDAYGPYPGGPEEPGLYSRSPSGEWEAGKRRVIRGGSWGEHHVFMRFKHRGSLESDESDFRIGFRCAMSTR